MKRIFLFLVTNFAVLALLTLVIFVVERVFGGGRTRGPLGVFGDLRLRRRADLACTVEVDGQAHDGRARHHGGTVIWFIRRSTNASRRYSRFV
jgi:hypothetical protein